MDAAYGAEVTSHHVHGDASFCESHVFSVQVWVNQDMYTISRSYTNFCDFDAILRRKYPKSSLPPLPLAGSPVFAKFNQRQKIPVDALERRGSLGRERQSSVTSPTPEPSRKPVKRTDMSEDISQRRIALTQYLSQLFTLPEILHSQELLNFLDEESEDGDEFTSFTPSTYDIIMGGEELITRTVTKDFEIPVELQSKQILVWRFITKHKDIGFSVVINNQCVIPYQRHNSHEVTIDGMLEATNDCTAILIWDNSYSKMRSKTLSCAVKVLDPEDYESHQLSCAEISRERRHFERRRQALRAALIGSAEALMHSPNVSVGSPVDKQSYATDELKAEIAQLRHEKASLQNALIDAEAAWKQESHVKNMLNDQYGADIAEKDATIASLTAQVAELTLLKAQLREKQEENNDLLNRIDRLTAECEAHKEAAMEAMQQSRRDNSSYQSIQVQYDGTQERLRELSDTIIQLQNTINSQETALINTKREKKQLKSYALQMKKDQDEMMKKYDAMLKEMKHFESMVIKLNSDNYELTQQLMQLSEKYSEFLHGKSLQAQCVENGSPRSSDNNESHHHVSRPNSDFTATTSSTAQKPASRRSFISIPSMPTMHLPNLLGKEASKHHESHGKLNLDETDGAENNTPAQSEGPKPESLTSMFKSWDIMDTLLSFEEKFDNILAMRPDSPVAQTVPRAAGPYNPNDHVVNSFGF